MKFLSGFFALLFVSSSALAESAAVRGLVGVDFGFASGVYKSSDPFFDEEVVGMSLAYGARAGVRIGDHFGIDVGTLDLGTFEDDVFGGEDSISTDMTTVSLLGLVPVSDQLSVLFRLGQARWDITEKFEFGIGSVKDDDSGSDLYFGFGLEAALAENFVLGAELQLFQMEPTLFQFKSDVVHAVTNASLMYRF